GRTIQNDSNYKEVASMFASLDEENQDKVMRSIKRAFNEVKTEAGEYLDESGLTADNELIDEDQDLVFNLTMPTNFNEAATVGIAEATHAYIVNSAIADWYMVTNKGDAAEYVSLAQKSMEMIRKSLSKRSRPMRRKAAGG
ncbi:MAG: hypothetical protein K2H18_02945, partial [Muribaculaceae bacterium]|nr:hypothetical protein [Muribaculaceae bacterium]